MIDEIKEAMNKVHKDGWSNFNDASCEDSKFIAEYDNLRECQGGLIAISETVEDATFIANTPTYIRHLLDELEKAQKENERMKSTLEEISGYREILPSDTETYELAEAFLAVEDMASRALSTLKCTSDES